MARGEDLFVGEDLESLLEEADRVRSLWGSRLIDVSHLLIAMGRRPSVGAELFAQFGLPADRLEAELTRAPDRSASSVVAPPPPRSRPPAASTCPSVRATGLPCAATAFNSLNRPHSHQLSYSKGKRLHRLRRRAMEWIGLMS